MPGFAALSSCLLFAQAADPAKSGSGSMVGTMISFGLIIVLFYMLMIRPERRRKAELAEMLTNLKKNDRVVTIGGIYGTVVAASKDSEEVTLKVDETTNTKLRMQRSAIARVLSAESSGSGKTVS
jgi:preprotein translocase subunit YajC